jgi:excisionase family DNA binding protein
MVIQTMNDGGPRTPSEPARVLLRPEEAARAVGLSRSQFFKLLADGSIRSLKVGRLRRVPVAELEAWVAREMAEQAPAGVAA